MPKEFKFLFKPLLLFIFLFSVLFSQDDCNDPSALNFNSDSNSSNECVFLNNIPSLGGINDVEYNEDTIVQRDLNEFITGFDDFFDNVSLTTTCDDIMGIDSCNINDANFLTINLEPNYDSQTGFFNVLVFYNGNPVANDMVSIIVSPVNDAPELTFIEDHSIDEDHALDLILSAIDIDDDVLIYEVTTSYSSDVEVVGDQVMITPSEDYNGSFDITVLVSDQDGLSDSQIFTLTVNPVNDSLQITTPNDNLEAMFDIKFELFIEVEDVDDDAFSFDLVNQPLGMTIVPYTTSAIVSYTPQESDSFDTCGGVECFTFQVDVSDDENLTVSMQYEVKIVESNNQLPIIEFSNSDNTVNEDSNITVNFTVSDDDGFNANDLSVIAIYSRGYIVNEYHSASGSGPNYSTSFSLRPNWNGPFELKIIADDVVSFSTETLEINVNPINDNPYITGYQNISFNEGSNTNVNIFISDIDTNTFLNESPYNIVNMSFEIEPDESSPNIIHQLTSGGSGNSSAVINFSTENLDWFGQENFTITLDDGESGPVNQSFLVTVNNVNDSPTIGNISNQTIDEDSILNLSIDIEDIDSENLSLSASSDHLSFEFNNNNMEITPSKHYNGSDLNVEVTVSDGSLSASTNFNLSILPINDSPFTNDINSSLEEDTQIDIELSGTSGLCTDTVLNNSDGSITCDCENLESGACDIEDQNLTYQILQNPSNAIVEINGSLVSYVPNLNFSGVDEFIYQVCDMSSLCSNGNVNISISPVNDEPIAENKSFEINEDEINYEIVLDATDVESDNLDYSILNEPDFGTYELNQNILLYNPNLDYFGQDEFIFNVSDGENVIEVTYSISILPVNDAPILSLVEDVTFNEDETTAIILEASDVDDEDLVYTISDGISIYPLISGLQVFGVPLSFTSLKNFNGVEEFTITISDDEGLFVEQNFNVTVQPVNDKPFAISGEVTVNEDESIDIQLLGTDIDEDELTYIIFADPLKGTVSLSDNIVTYQNNDHFNGIDSFEFKVSDGSLDSDAATISINITSINDRPRARKIIQSIEEECSLNIEVNQNTDLCTENIIDGIICSCDSELYLSGACDIESDDLTYEVLSQPENGFVEFNGSIATYTPNIDYVSEEGFPDVFQYKVCDDQLLCSYDNDSEILSDGACINESQCPYIEVTVHQLNDTPIVNCIDGDCNNPLLLSNYYVMYEDCLDYDDFPNEDTNNLDNCDDLDGISISQLRTFNTELFEVCNEDSDDVLWYDTDCIYSDNPNQFDFGIAVDIESNLTNNENKGIWKYKLKGQNSFNDFEIDIGCNFKLLDQEDEIKFFPNNDYYSVNEEFPSFIFYPWDKTVDSDAADLCVESLNNALLRDDSCGGANAYSSKSIVLEWEVIAVNDTPRLDSISDLIDEGSSLVESCDIENDVDCTENQDYQVEVNGYDLKDPEDNLYYYISSQTTSNNEAQSLFKKINFNNDVFIEDNLVNPSLVFNEEIIANNLLKLDLTNYANGLAKIKIGVSDRENFEEGLFIVDSFIVKINSVNNRINSYSLVQNLYEYDDYDNQSMIVSVDNQYSIKYPPYQYNEIDLNINDINASNFSPINDYMDENPYEMNDLYFKWNRTTDEGYYLDFDIDPLLNDIPYELYYRLELLDQENKVFVLKDSIPDSNYPGLDNAYINVKLSSGPYKTYVDGDIYDAQTDLNAQIDTTGLTLYNWRVVAENYEKEEILENYDFYNTSTSISDNPYLVNLHMPSMNFDFVLNDIYNNYFDLYLSPVPSSFTEVDNYYNIGFNQNSEIYLNYEGDGIFPNEINSVSLLALFDNLNNDLNTQNIYQTDGDFNEFGLMTWYAPIKNDVGTIKIRAKSITYNSILPNSYNSINSNSGKFGIEFYSDSNMNILLQEDNKNNIVFNNDYNLVSDVLVIKSNKDIINYDIKISYNIDNMINNNITFAKIIDNTITPIPSSIENGQLITYSQDFGSYIIVNSYDGDSTDEIPNEASIISCYPNPFNPSTTISYMLENDMNVNLKIYNINGRIVFENDNINTKAGLNEYKWNGVDNKGNFLTSGIYFVMIEFNDKILMDKVTLLK